MSKKRIIIDVKEILSHKVELELDEDELNLLIEHLDGNEADESAGYYCNKSTLEDGEWELLNYEVIDD